jgi:hypothetical protein
VRGIGTVAFSAVLCGMIAGAAFAADIPTKAPVVAAPSGSSFLLFGGVAVDQGGWFGDVGFVTPFNGNLNLPGWLFRARGGDGHYDYNRTIALKQGVDYQIGEAMIGYQWFMGPSRVSIYAGVNVENHNNPDPLATVAGTAWGFKTQGEIFTIFTPNTYGFLLGTYSTAFNSYFVLGKLGWKVLPAVAIGPELTALGNDRFDAMRAGGFVAFDIGPTASIIFSGGYSWDERRNSLNDNSGAYGTVHVRKYF